MSELSAEKDKGTGKEKKRRDITIQEKKEIIDELERCENVSATARTFNTTRRHVQKIKDNKQAILGAFHSDTTPNTRKRLHKSANGSTVEVTPKRRKKPKQPGKTTNKSKVEMPPATAGIAADHPLPHSLVVNDAAVAEASTSKHQSNDNQSELGGSANHSTEISGLDKAEHDSSTNAEDGKERVQTEQEEIRDIAKDLESSASEFVYRDPPSISMSIQTPGSVDSVKALEAAESLLDLNAVPSSNRVSNEPIAVHEEIAGLPEKPVNSKVNSELEEEQMKVVHFEDLPTTIDYLNSPPENKTETPPCTACSLQSQIQPAKNFCVDCEQHFCTKHVELHCSLFGEKHRIVESNQILHEATNSPQSRVNCERHNQNTIVSGCDNCSEMFCVDCLCWLNSKEEDREALYPCSQGIKHEPFPLMKLEQRLKRKAVGNLENKLQEGQELLSAAQTKLGEAISTLHTRRDKEMEELRNKFFKLEEETRASFDREGQLAKLEKLVTCLQTELLHVKVVDDTKTQNTAENIAQYRQSTSDGQKWIIPSLKLPQYELRLMHGGGTGSGVKGFDWIQSRHPPSLGTFLADTKLNVDELVIGNRVCQYKNITYSFDYKHGIVVSVDESGTVSNIITLDKNSGYSILDVAVNNAKIFVLTTNDHIHAYSLTGELITSWELTESCYRITVSGDLLVISTSGNDDLLLIYTEEGEKIRQPHTRLAILDLYPVDSKSVIVCCDDESVCRVDIRTGGIMWRREDINAGSAVYDGHGNLLNWTTDHDLCILDIGTGETLKIISREDIEARLRYELGSPWSVELDISGDDTLLILYRGDCRQISHQNSSSDDYSDEEEVHLFKLQLDYQ